MRLMLSDTALGGPKKEEISPVDRGFFEASALEVVFAGAKLGRFAPAVMMPARLHTIFLAPAGFNGLSLRPVRMCAECSA